MAGLLTEEERKRLAQEQAMAAQPQHQPEPARGLNPAPAPVPQTAPARGISSPDALSDPAMQQAPAMSDIQMRQENGRVLVERVSPDGSAQVVKDWSAPALEQVARMGDMVEPDEGYRAKRRALYENSTGVKDGSGTKWNVSAGGLAYGYTPEGVEIIAGSRAKADEVRAMQGKEVDRADAKRTTDTALIGSMVKLRESLGKQMEQAAMLGDAAEVEALKSQMSGVDNTIRTLTQSAQTPAQGGQAAPTEITQKILDNLAKKNGAQTGQTVAPSQPAPQGREERQLPPQVAVARVYSEISPALQSGQAVVLTADQYEAMAPMFAQPQTAPVASPVRGNVSRGLAPPQQGHPVADGAETVGRGILGGLLAPNPMVQRLWQGGKQALGSEAAANVLGTDYFRSPQATMTPEQMRYQAELQKQQALQGGGLPGYGVR